MDRRHLQPIPFGIFLLLITSQFACEHPQAASRPSPPVVQVVDVVQKDVPIYSEWIATLYGLVNAQIQPQVSGYLIRQDYREGSFVHQSDVLFEIDPRPFQAVLDQAKAQLSQAEAQLGTAIAECEARYSGGGGARHSAKPVG